MLNLQLPEPTDFPASVFDQNGTLIFMGPRENCELLAEEVGALLLECQRQTDHS